MLKRLLIGILFFVIVCASLCVWAVHSPSATAWIVSALIKKNVKSFKLDDLTIGAQQFVYPGQFFLSDVRIKLTSGSEQYTVAAKKLDLDHLGQALAGSAQIPVNAKDVSVDSKSIQIPSADIHGAVLVRTKQKNTFEGTFVIPAMEAYRYKSQNISANFTGGSYGISFKNVQAELYKGKVLGKVDVNWANGIHYRTNLQFEGIDISALKEVDDSIYKQIDGIIQGTIVIGGSVHSFETLRLKAQITKGGRINASLFRQLMPQLNLLANAAELKTAVENGTKVPAEVVTFDLRNVDERKISGPVHLSVRKFNLDLNTSLDILCDGSWFSLIEAYRNLSK